MRIVHLSDIHVGMIPHRIRGFGGKRILGIGNYVLRRWRHIRLEFIERALIEIRRLQPEWVVCTGDITTVSNPEEFEAATAALRPIRDACGQKFLYVPGNHDAYVHDRACREALRAAFVELNGGRWELEDLPATITVGGLKMILVDEAVPTPWVYSTGRLNERSKALLESETEACSNTPMRPIVIGHFPVRDRHGSLLGFRRRLQGSEILDRLMTEGKISAHLCGHIHQPFLRENERGVLEICAGSLTMSGYFSVLDYLPEKCSLCQFWVDLAGREVTPEPIGGELPAPS